MKGCILRLELTRVDDEWGQGEQSRIMQRFLFSTSEHNLLRWGKPPKRANEFGFGYIKYEKPQ